MPARGNGGKAEGCACGNRVTARAQVGRARGERVLVWRRPRLEAAQAALVTLASRPHGLRPVRATVCEPPGASPPARVRPGAQSLGLARYALHTGVVRHGAPRHAVRPRQVVSVSSEAGWLGALRRVARWAGELRPVLTFPGGPTFLFSGGTPVRPPCQGCCLASAVRTTSFTAQRDPLI